MGLNLVCCEAKYLLDVVSLMRIRLAVSMALPFEFGVVPSDLCLATPAVASPLKYLMWIVVVGSACAGSRMGRWGGGVGVM